MMPNIDKTFRLNWASFGVGEKRGGGDDGADYTIFVGDLAADVTDYMLQVTFRNQYSSVKGAKIVTDRTIGCSKGYGFVRFGDVNEQTRAMTEMHGVYCSSKLMCIGAATTKKTVAGQQQYSTKVYSRPGGDRIYGVFDNQLPAALKKLPFDRHLSLQNVRKVVSEVDGYQPHLIAPEQGYARLIESSLNYSKGPAEASVDAVQFVLKELMRKSIGETHEMERFPTLQAELAAASYQALERFREES